MKQLIDSAMTARSDEISAADPFFSDASSLPNAQLVECLCHSGWDFSDPSFTGFFTTALSIYSAPRAQVDAAALLAQLEVMLHRTRVEATGLGSRCAPRPVGPPGSV